MEAARNILRIVWWISLGCGAAFLALLWWSSDPDGFYAGAKGGILALGAMYAVNLFILDPIKRHISTIEGRFDRLDRRMERLERELQRLRSGRQ